MSNQETKQDKLWGGRFQEATSDNVEKFTASIPFDQQLWRFDLEGSQAHATMLGACGIISAEESAAIVQGLQAIGEEIASGDWQWSLKLEDVHMNIEARLIERLGEVGKKLHTGRSRNDQVATDMRLYLRYHIDKILELLKAAQKALLNQAKAHHDAIMPGFTHLQIAQPITVGFHLLAWQQMLKRDAARLRDCRARVNVCPLGSAALAGTSYPIDRALTARLLGFSQPTANALDAVSDRDFIIEFMAAASILMLHLSRMAEELVLWSSPLFQFIDLPDRFCTGSSIMPQKKNPDVPELLRGKGGRVTGHLMGLLQLMKGQPLAYNKDNQEDKEGMFDAVATVSDSLQLFTDMLPAITFRVERLRQVAAEGFATATDLADYLVRRGLAFRDAHHAVGRLVHYSISKNKDLAALSLAELQAVAPQIEGDVFQVLTVEGSVAARQHCGGTAPSQVLSQIAEEWAELGE